MTRQASVASVLCVAVIQLLSPINAFSAKLSRPWELPSTASMSLTTRRRRWDDFVLQSTSVPAHDNRDSDDTTTERAALDTDDEEGEDTMKLQTSKYSTSEVIIAVPDSTTIHFSSVEPPRTPVDQPTVASSLNHLFGMTRPSNFPGVVLLHIMGVYLALQSPHVKNAQLLPTLAQASMMIVLCCLLLTSAASMVVRFIQYSLTLANQFSISRNLYAHFLG